MVTKAFEMGKEKRGQTVSRRGASRPFHSISKIIEATPDHVSPEFFEGTGVQPEPHTDFELCTPASPSEAGLGPLQRSQHPPESPSLCTEKDQKTPCIHYMRAHNKRKEEQRGDVSIPTNIVQGNQPALSNTWYDTPSKVQARCAEYMCSRSADMTSFSPPW